jgi:hypothetical protein
MKTRLALPRVTLCAATSVNFEATLAALARCLDVAEFGDAILFSDKQIDELPAGLRHVEIDNLAEASAYSEFILREMVQHVCSDHVLVVQWDGFILFPGAWQERFLDFDYVGAVWPQFSDGANIGNGGFSLRSRRLLEACLDTEFVVDHPEDVAICRLNRQLLEEKHGIRFADAATARKFSFERESSRGETFGFHGVFNMPAVLGKGQFWQTYRGLEDRRSVFHDALPIAANLGPRLGLTLMRDYLLFKTERLKLRRVRPQLRPDHR